MAATAKYSSSSTLPLHDKVAIVTGSSRGIGRTIALHLASLGAKLVINYITNSTLAQEVVHEINSSWSTASLSTRAIAVQADVSDPTQVKALFDIAENTFQVQTHILITCAGIVDPFQPSIANTTVEYFEKTLNVNTKGTFLCIREAANRIQRGGGGRIITFSAAVSEDSKMPKPCGVFRASTIAVEEMTKILAKELKGTKITANCVAPGIIATKLVLSMANKEMLEIIASESPLLRLGEPKDIVPIIKFLVGDDGEWVNGQVVRVNGGA
ncbi:hypothetical protein Ancab_039101 [Ancistrocladus abbreviatus]